MHVVARAGSAEDAAGSALHAVIVAGRGDAVERRDAATLEEVDLTGEEGRAEGDLGEQGEGGILSVGILHLTHVDQLGGDVGVLAELCQVVSGSVGTCKNRTIHRQSQARRMK